MANADDPIQPVTPSAPAAQGADRYRLSPEEIDELRKSFEASARWMDEQLEIDPELKHL